MPRPRNIFPDFTNEQDGIVKFFRTLPGVVGNTAELFFKDSFRREGFIDKKYERWKPRKRTDKNPLKRQLLVESGTLGRSIQIVAITANSVTVGTDIIYARIHNEGGTIAHPGGTSYTVSKKNGVKIAKFVSKDKAKELTESGVQIKHTKRGTPYIVNIVDGANVAKFLSEDQAAQATAKGETVKKTKGGSIKIPKRQFIGESDVLERRIVGYMEKHLSAHFRNSGATVKVQK